MNWCLHHLPRRHIFADFNYENVLLQIIAACVTIIPLWIRMKSDRTAAEAAIAIAAAKVKKLTEDEHAYTRGMIVANKSEMLAGIEQLRRAANGNGNGNGGRA